MLYPNFVLAKEKLIFAVDVIRHGDRNPIYQLSTIQHEWPEGLGQLTEIGKQQEKSLGEKMRKRYIIDNNLLPQSYEEGTVYVRSTNVPRTKMSALSLLSGLYPEASNIQMDVPLELEKDAFTLGFKTQEGQKDVYKYVLDTDEWKKFEDQYRSSFKVWEDKTGFSVKNLIEASSLSDTLNICLLKNIALPKEITTNDVEVLRKIRTWTHVQIYSNAVLGKLNATRAVTILLDTLKKAAIDYKQNNHQLRWALFSAHDTTLMGLMGRIGSPLSEIPTYASNLNFSLYEDDSRRAESKFFVKVFFNEKVVTLPICDKKDVCSLDKLQKLR
jgi:acid phosphatase